MALPRIELGLHPRQGRVLTTGLQGPKKIKLKTFKNPIGNR